MKKIVRFFRYELIRILFRLINRNPRYDPMKMKWSWCFHCGGPTTHCPHCDGNACACGCLKYPKCPEWKFWAAIHGKRYELARVKYFRPSQEELIEHIKWLESIETDSVGRIFTSVHHVLQLVEHAQWHGVGVDVTIKSSISKHGDWSCATYDNYTIKLVSIPTEVRNHILDDKTARRYMRK